MKVLIVDNFDSFTYNLYQSVGTILTQKYRRFKLEVKRNNQITAEKIISSSYSDIIISPGPGDPSDATYFGVCAQIITRIGKHVPVLGVCLGMQGMAYYYGGKVIRATRPMHGKISIVQHDGKGVFKGVPQNIKAMRYHSLVAEPHSLPSCLEVSATAINNYRHGPIEIMGLRHKNFPIEGIQFHPESFATEYGNLMLQNFLNSYEQN